MPKVLLVDDDVELTKMLIEYLHQEGFDGVAVHNGKDGIGEALSGAYDVVVLDVMMPHLSGIEVLRHIRSENSLPVLMLTARGDNVDKIVGLDLGADDYVAKPCTPGEIVARLRAILRRTETRKKARVNEKTQIGALVLSPGERTVKYFDRAIELTGTEFCILEVLARNAGLLISKQDLSKKALGVSLTPYDRRLDVHISSIRQKLGLRPDGSPWIQTVRGLGYQMVSE